MVAKLDTAVPQRERESETEKERRGRPEGGARCGVAAGVGVQGISIKVVERATDAAKSAQRSHRLSVCVCLCV